MQCQQPGPDGLACEAGAGPTPSEPCPPCSEMQGHQVLLRQLQGRWESALLLRPRRAGELLPRCPSRAPWSLLGLTWQRPGDVRWPGAWLPGHGSTLPHRRRWPAESALWHRSLASGVGVRQKGPAGTGRPRVPVWESCCCPAPPDMRDWEELVLCLPGLLPSHLARERSVD